jgi:hypothetical protein
VAAGILVGLLLAGLIIGVVVPFRPGALGPASAAGVALVCIGAVLLIDWQFLRKR